PDLLEELVELRRRVGEVAHDWRQVNQERIEGGDCRVQGLAAAREGVAEALQGRLRRVARGLVEGAEDVVELHGVARELERDGVARAVVRLRAAGGQLDVLEAERRALADDQRGVPGQRLHRLVELDRKSTRLNSSHSQISYAVFCLKKKKNNKHIPE